VYRGYFADKAFVRVRTNPPATKDTTARIPRRVREGSSRQGAGARGEDNLVRGASGVAVQNFNRVFGFDERTGLM